MGERTQALIEIVDENKKQLLGYSLHYQWGCYTMLDDLLVLESELFKVDIFNCKEIITLIENTSQSDGHVFDQDLLASYPETVTMQNHEKMTDLFLYGDNDDGYANLTLTWSKNKLWNPKLQLFTHDEQLVDLAAFENQFTAVLLDDEDWQYNFLEKLLAQKVELMF